MQAKKKSSAGGGIYLVHERVGTFERTLYLVFFGNAFGKNAFYFVIAAVKFETYESEPRLTESKIGKLGYFDEKISRRVVVRGVFNAERRNRFGYRFAETYSYGLAAVDIVGEYA